MDRGPYSLHRQYILILLTSITVCYGWPSRDSEKPSYPQISISDIIDEWRETIPECGLPTFTNSLPLKYRRDLRRIWDKFPISSKNCARELAATRAVLSTLPDDIKLRLLNHKSISPPSAHQKTPFLLGLSQEQRNQFNQILQNRSISENERFEQLKDWAAEHLDLIAQKQLEQFASFIKNRALRHQEKLKNLSAEARDAFERLDAIRREKMQIFDRLSESAKKELAALWRPKCARVGEKVEESAGNEEDTEMDIEEIELACTPTKYTSGVTNRLVIDPMRRRRPHPPSTPPPLSREIIENGYFSSTEPSVEIIRFRPSSRSSLYKVITSSTPRTTTVLPFFHEKSIPLIPAGPGFHSPLPAFNTYGQRQTSYTNSIHPSLTRASKTLKPSYGSSSRTIELPSLETTHEVLGVIGSKSTFEGPRTQPPEGQSFISQLQNLPASSTDQISLILRKIFPNAHFAF